MEGITILNTITETAWADITGIIFIACMVIGLITSLIALLLIEDYFKAASYTISLSVFCFIVALIIGIFGPKREYTTYQTLIGDNVSMNEFYDKYEIINKQGDIYLIKEKNN